MNLLFLYIAIPLLMLGGLWAVKGGKSILAVMVAGSSALLLLSITLVVLYLEERTAGKMDQMLFRSDIIWYAPLNIALSVGADGITVALLLLSSIIVFTGVFASWRLQPLTKEYFLLSASP